MILHKSKPVLTCNSLTGINSNLNMNTIIIDNTVIMFCRVQNEDILILRIKGCFNQIIILLICYD